MSVLYWLLGIIIICFLLSRLKVYKHQARPSGIIGSYGENMECKFCKKTNHTWRSRYPLCGECFCLKSDVTVRWYEWFLLSINCRDDEYINSQRGEVSNED